MEKTMTWVVVADNCQAKIFRVTKVPHLEEIAYLEHPESRLHNQDLVSSKPGRNFQSGGTTRHAYQQETEPRKIEADRFATFVADYLGRSIINHEYNRLYILAEPSFLGLLRQHLNGDVRKSIIAEGAKELTTADQRTIEQHFSELII